MELSSSPIMNIGKKIERVREFRGIKQETLASHLNISQQAVSKLENEATISEERLQQVADALGVTPDAIKNFDTERAIYNINNFTDIHDNEFKDSVVGQQFNPTEKIIELYERLLQSEREKIDLLKKK